ncbi:hypothetical protein BP00DRAFT_393475 [Aspergillus indologenus CBS 114.80]|uniref:Uncharacterized protein n=1 Tax=Aspergillus indologenus CBS 114.80 TaxID=1450541 RepID=A0A2V5IFQ9_9EURO|nr:hypothetical protein BP00DRAFT_393475 [Aspergillus indologenus CBS 114.80]
MVRSVKPDISKVQPIGGTLESLRESFETTCEDLGLAISLDSISQFELQGKVTHPNPNHTDLRNLALDLTLALCAFPDIRQLPSATGRRNLRDDLSGLTYVITSDTFDIDRFRPLLQAIWDKAADDVVWDRVYATVVEVTPPPKPIPFRDQTPYSHTTSSFVNSSGQRKYTDAVLRQELGSIFIDVPNFL